jgi:putative transposase
MSKQLVENSKTDNISHKSLKLRIYPNQEQKILIDKTFGCCRKLYNEHLQERNEFYIENILPVKNKATKTEINQIYKTFKPKTEKEWKSTYPYLTEVSSTSLQQSRMDCDTAFVNFFKSSKGARKGKSGFPKFKSKKDNHQSYREPNTNENCQCLFENRLVKIPKLGKVIFKDRAFPKWWSQIEKLCSMTVLKSCSGNYYVSVLFEIKNVKYKTSSRKEAIGLDFSPSEMYVSSENQTGKDFGYVAQKQKYHKQLKRLGRKLARKQFLKDKNSPRKLPSKNREKARIKLARLEEHIANCRKDWIEKETLRLVTSYDKVVVEDLNLKGISKFLRNAKNMNDTSWATFVSRLQAKGKDYDCKVIKADRYFPSSQLCSKCGFQYKGLKLSEREWTCPNCGTNHIRDVNAAINLKNYVPMEGRKLTPVESSKVANLAELALQATELDETGSYSQATSSRNVLSL